MQAQTISLSNGGAVGVYQKANKDLNFRADAEDVIGAWDCQLNPLQLTYASNTSVLNIVENLVEQNLMYQLGQPANKTPHFSSDLGLAGDSHVVVWDSSVDDYANSTFDIRASIDQTGQASDTKVMQSYECKLASSRTISIMQSVAARSTMWTWCAALQGAVYDGGNAPASNNTRIIMEQVLNSMTMVAGGNDYLLNTSAAQESQGCLVTRTNIFWPVIVLTALPTFVLLCLALYAVITLWHIKRLKKWRVNGLSQEESMICTACKDMPNSLFDWMVQAVQESGSDSAVSKARHLKEWELGVIGGTGRLGIQRRGRSSLPLGTGSGNINKSSPSPQGC